MSVGSQPVSWTLMWLRGGLSGGVNASIENSTTFTGAFLFGPARAKLPRCFRVVSMWA
jgi:hypothetical protein